MPTIGPRIKDLRFKTFFLLFPAVIVYILITDSDGCGDLPRDFRFFPIAGGAVLFLSIVWSAIDKQRHSGCSQILAAILLLFRKTATLGAILMVTIMSNIVFVNFAFDVCVKFFSCS